MHVWGAWLCDSGYTTSHHRSTATKQRGTQPCSSKASLVTTAWKSVTWDFTLSRPIQHCEEHKTGLAFQSQAATLQDNWPSHHAEQQLHWSLVRGWLIFTALLFHVHTVLYVLKIILLFIKEKSLSQRIISSPFMWARLIIFQTDVWEIVVE